MARELKTSYGTKFSGMDEVKIVEDSLYAGSSFHDCL